MSNIISKLTKDSYLRSVFNNERLMVSINMTYGLVDSKHNVNTESILYRISTRDKRRTFYISNSKLYNYNHNQMLWYTWSKK